MKTFVITISKTFMKGHSRVGDPTHFKEKVLSGEKIHTIRANYPYWKDIIDKIQKGEGFLSVRQWTGKPYNSGQREVKRFYKVGYEKIQITHTGAPFVGSRELPITRLANNDGLTVQDFDAWFDESFEGIIIHFTDFRYNQPQPEQGELLKPQPKSKVYDQ